ncbi:hypothetical protein ANO11243_014620 [Dothideomycetidae sp. 11243]|nr:hypothetical protein ANO11243_014620 [fungal sp. No.11243]
MAALMSLPQDPRVPGGSTYDQARVIAIVTNFYDFLATLPYVKPEHILRPPIEGWPSITREYFIDELRKSEEVYQLLKHLPYLDQNRDLQKQYQIKPYTDPCDYRSAGLEGYKWGLTIEDQITPLGEESIPAWCVPLACQHEGQFGSYPVLDTSDGTITDCGFDVCYDDDQILYADDDPRAWRNKLSQTHSDPKDATVPIAEYFGRLREKFQKLEYIGFWDDQGSDFAGPRLEHAPPGYVHASGHDETLQPSTDVRAISSW